MIYLEFIKIFLYKYLNNFLTLNKLLVSLYIFTITKFLKSKKLNEINVVKERKFCSRFLDIFEGNFRS